MRLFTQKINNSKTLFWKNNHFFLLDSFFNKSQSITQFTKSKFCLRNLVPIRWKGLLSLSGPKRAQKRCCSYSFSSVVSNAPFRCSSISMMTVRIPSGIYYHKWEIGLLWNLSWLAIFVFAYSSSEPCVFLAPSILHSLEQFL